jgi:F-type H+-transporting ATPase subunit gamma
MPSLKDIKSRIQSVKNTSKITNAMKLVSAAKFARASQAVAAARPYARGFDELVKRIAARSTIEHPLLATSKSENVLFVIFSTDRGLCGPLNSNVMKAVLPQAEAAQRRGRHVQIAAWGRKGKDFARKYGYETISSKEKMTEKPNIDLARSLSKELKELFIDGKVGEVYLVFPRFQSALVQEPEVIQLFPAALEESSSNEGNTNDIIIEPNPDQILDSLLHRRVDIQLYQALLETAASEHGSRMTAMDSATNNAREVNRKLTIQYNRARQAAITTELIEITSGASALAN